MGRPAWANDTQWAFLSAQAERYIPVKGTKATKDFWPELFDGWVSKWPESPLDSAVSPSTVSSLTPPLQEEQGSHKELAMGNSPVAPNRTLGPGSEPPQTQGDTGYVEPPTGDDSDTEGDLPTETSKSTKTQAGNSKKPLTWRKVSTRASILWGLGLINTTEVATIHKQPYSRHEN